MQREVTNKHFNIRAIVRANTPQKIQAFAKIKRLDDLIIKCCGYEPSINLREIDVSKSNLEGWQNETIISCYANTISIDKALKMLGYSYTMKELPLNELKTRLNRLWIARCKANDEFLEFATKLNNSGYTFAWSSDERKQFEIHKKGA